MTANEQGLLHVIEFEKQKMEQMQNIITKVEDLRDNFRSHHALEENAYQRACDDVVELLQLLQQTPCTTLLPDVEQVIKSRIKHFNNNYHKYEGKELSDALSTIKRLVPPSMFEDFVRQ